MSDSEIEDLLNTPAKPVAAAPVTSPKAPASPVAPSAPTVAPTVSTAAKPTSDAAAVIEETKVVQKAIADEASTMPPNDIPLPESELTPEQKEIRQLRHQLALRQAADLEKAEYPEVAAESENKVLIHFLSDGFTWAGKVWYRGQELEFDIPGRPYDGTKDRNGYSWLSMTEMEQVRAYGEVKWRKGPWPGDGYELPEAATAEQLRRRAAPVMPRI